MEKVSMRLRAVETEIEKDSESEPIASIVYNDKYIVTWTHGIEETGDSWVPG